MANTAQATKRAKQSEKKRRHNASFRSMTRTTIKKTVRAIVARNLDAANLAYQHMVPVLDRAATKGLISTNKAARHKSRLSLRLRQLSQSDG